MIGKLTMNFIRYLLKLKFISIEIKYLGAVSFITIFLFFTLPFLYEWLKIRGILYALINWAFLVFSAACSLHGLSNAKGISLILSWISFLLFLFFVGCTLRIAYH